MVAALLVILSFGASAGDAQATTPGDGTTPPPDDTRFERGDTVRIAGDCLRVDQELHFFILKAFANGDRLTSVPLSAVEDCLTGTIDSESPEGAGVSPFAGLCGMGAPEGAGVSPFSRDCDLAGHVVANYGNRALSVSIINPDSMHPVCVVGAAPTPHP